MSNKQLKTLLNLLRQQGIKDEKVLDAIAVTPREFFIDEALSHQAYDNIALPIGARQTISQPYIVAKMTELLELTKESNVLEIGTGSGYQTAILAQLVKHVYSVERIKALQWQAKRRLKKLDLHNVSTMHADGWSGWISRAPYHAIIVTAASTTIPMYLLEQLEDGGKLVIPIAENNSTQWLYKITRYGDKFKNQKIESVRFVPLIQGELD